MLENSLGPARHRGFEDIQGREDIEKVGSSLVLAVILGEDKARLPARVLSRGERRVRL